MIIGYTLGDQAGIGPEVIEAALQSSSLSPDVEYRLIGSAIPAIPGHPSHDTAQAAFEHLELAAQTLKEGRIDAIVTGPVCKEGLHEVGFTWPGQTEFFAERLNTPNYAMCLSGAHLTVALATIHTSLSSVPQLLNTHELVRIGTLLADFLRRMGKAAPRIALAGLNPHAGEHGAFGHEEETIIAPAVAQLNEMKSMAIFYGPEVPDAVYRATINGQFDGILAPYHDQGLIPLKMVDFDTAVNITLGLPRPRVSPDHGTAFGIAGQKIANPASMIRAFHVASLMAQQ
ncbi:MAG: 4-hydroxythreonine-4-phosphate dehydrogenase PdxA [Akkermansia sp.]